MNDALETCLQFAGRLHPIILHVPIGLICGLFFIEAVSCLRRKPISLEIVTWLVWLTAGSATAAAVTGYLLHLEDANEGWMVERHLQFGLALTSATLVMAILHAFVHKPAYYRGMLLVSVGLMIPTGHLGGSMTHGDRFLIEPFIVGRSVPSTEPDPAQSDRQDVFTATIQPILTERCTGCHGESRRKGGLALHSFAALAEGGNSGPVFIAGDPLGSEIVRRLRLPMDADGHMPPAGKPQPGEEQIAVIEQWISQGATTMPLDPVDSTGDGAPGTNEQKIPTADPRALAALDEHLVHYEALADDDRHLSVSFAAVADKTDDATAQRLLEPLLVQLESVSLERSAVGDETVGMLARTPNLRRVNLSRTNITDQALISLGKLASLQELVVTQTRLTDEAIVHLQAMNELERVYLWGTNISGDAIARLREGRPELHIDDGTFRQVAALEVEPELRFTSDRPLPGEAPSIVDLKPINSTCPVTGNPVNLLYTIVYEQKMIAFCCSDCAVRFWADPKQFLANIVQPDSATSVTE